MDFNDWKNWQLPPWRELLKAGFIPALGLAYLSLAGWEQFYLNVKTPPVMVTLLPIPIVMIVLWMRVLSPGEGLRPAFDQLLAGVSIAGFYIAALYYPPPKSTPLFWLSASAGLFAGSLMLVGGRTFLQRAAKEPYACGVAAVGALAGVAYFTMGPAAWHHLGPAVLNVVMALLHVLRIDATYTIDDRHRFFVELPQTEFHIAAGCSGLTGFALFCFLLANMMLFDWRLFRAWRCFNVYLIAFLVVFVVNTLRITAIIAFAAWTQGHRKHPTKLIAAVNDMFHAQFGWMLYLAVFFIFLTVVYKMAARDMRRPGAEAEEG
jgi:exosortase/archaeosortase family protein